MIIASNPLLVVTLAKARTKSRVVALGFKRNNRNADARFPRGDFAR